MMNGNNRRWLALAVLACLAAAGCPEQPIVREPIPGLTREAVLEQLNSRAGSMQTLWASASVKVRAADMRRAESLGGALRVQYPDKLRLRGYHDLLDYEPFDIGSNGREWFFHVHYADTNEIHWGSVADLERRFDPCVPLRPADVVTALGLGPLQETPGRRELLFTKYPGYYLFTEIATNESGRYISRRIHVKPGREDISKTPPFGFVWLYISRVETFRPDGAVDMIADINCDFQRKTLRVVPCFARIVVLREQPFMLELRLHGMEAGRTIRDKTFQTPDLGEIPTVIRHPMPTE